MKQMLAIVLALFIMASIFIPALAAGESGKAPDNSVKSGETDGSKTADAEKIAAAEKAKKDADSAATAEKDESALSAKDSKNKLDSVDGAGSTVDGEKRAAKKSRTVDSAGNKFILAKDARQSAKIEGDLAAIGGDTEVSRGVGGDVFTAGQNVIITDDEELQNVAAAGANVSVHVKKARNIYAAGGNVDLQVDDASKGVYIAGLSVTLAGTMTDAYVRAASANISGTIAENLIVRANNVTFDPDATVGGDVTIISKKRPDLPASIDPSKVTYKSPGVISSFKDGAFLGQTMFQRLLIILTVSGIVAAIILSLIMNAMRGGFFHERALQFKRYFWRDMLRGLAGIIVTPIIALLLIASVVGIPIGAVLLVVYAVAMYLAPVVSGVILGRLLFPKMNRFGSGVIATCFIWLLMLVPYLGIVVTVATSLYGIGSLIAAIPPRRNNKLKIRRVDETRDMHDDQHEHHDSPPVENPA